MADLIEGTGVHVPAKSVGLGSDYPSAMVACKYLRKNGKKGVLSDIPRVQDAKEIDLRLISKKLGFFILQIGDFSTEIELLEPLHSAITDLTKLVLMPEFVWKYRVRSLEEFRFLWKQQAGMVSHLVLIGHGDKSNLLFGNDKVSAKDFLDAFAIQETQGQAPVIISLCCNSGNGLFGKKVSASLSCKTFIGPSGSIHVSNAALFYQSFLSHSLIDGQQKEKAYQLSRVFTPGVTEFNMWNKTRLATKPSRKDVLGH